MHSTFSDAAVTICAPRATNPNAGLLHTRKSTDVCANATATVEVTIENHPVTVAVIEEQHEGTGSRIRKELDAVAFSRAWIVQERLQPLDYPESKASFTQESREKIWMSWKEIVASIRRVILPPRMIDGRL